MLRRCMRAEDDWSPPDGSAGEPPDPGIFAPRPEEIPPPRPWGRLTTQLATAQNTLDWANKKWHTRLVKVRWGKVLVGALVATCYNRREFRPALSGRRKR